MLAPATGATKAGSQGNGPQISAEAGAVSTTNTVKVADNRRSGLRKHDVIGMIPSSFTSR
jgi:hypothetical protein